MSGVETRFPHGLHSPWCPRVGEIGNQGPAVRIKDENLWSSVPRWIRRGQLLVERGALRRRHSAVDRRGSHGVRAQRSRRSGGHRAQPRRDPTRAFGDRHRYLVCSLRPSFSITDLIYAKYWICKSQLYLNPRFTLSGFSIKSSDLHLNSKISADHWK